MKKKEIFKNISLFVLVFISIALFANIWFSDNLWTDKYNFFDFFKRLSPQSEEASSAFAVDSIVTPRRFVVTGGGKRNIITAGTDGYSQCISEVLPVLKTVGAGFSSASYDEWKSKLKAKSVLVDFGVPCASALLSQINISVPAGVVQKILVVPDDTLTRRCMLYVQDASTEEIFKCQADSSSSVSGIISEYTADPAAQNIPYAFELGFDTVKTTKTEDITQNVLLDPTITVGLKDKTLPALSASVPDIFDSGTAPTASFLKLFFKGSGSIRRYVEKDGVNVFVDRQATLKITSDGCIEYTADGEGARLFNAQQSDTGAPISAVFSLVRAVSTQCGISQQTLSLSAAPSADENGNTVLRLDYCINGVPAVTLDGKGTPRPAVVAKIKDGRLIYFKLQIYSFQALPGSLRLAPMLKALDTLYSAADFSELKVSDIYVSYVTNSADDTVSAVWCAKIRDSDRVIIIDGE